MHAYDANHLDRLFGLSASAIRALTRAGNIRPVRRAGKLHYTFHDLLVLRTASALRAANISSRRINRTFQQLRSTLPAQRTLNQLSLAALGSRIAIREGGLLRDTETGQYALPLEIVEEKGHRSNPRAHVLFERALAIEEDDPDQAGSLYEACLRVDASHIEARINLGRLLHAAGRLSEAERIYRSSASIEPMLAFNLAVLLEDLGREPEAILTYRDVLDTDPLFADAHFNLARLYARAEDPKASLRHLLAYRRAINRQDA